MFSSSDTVSLFSLDQRVTSLVVPKSNRETVLQIAKEFEYPREPFFERTKFQIAEDLFTLILHFADKFWLVSPDANVLRASSLFVEYVDKPRDHPVRAEYEKEANGLNWLFFEYPTYLLTVKNWDKFGKRILMGADAIDEEWIPIVAERVRPFEGWSLCVEQSSYPASIADLLDVAKNGKMANLKPVRGQRGRPPSGAKNEYFKRYPERKPEDVSFDAIAAELTEAGFKISARMLQNYEKERGLR